MERYTFLVACVALVATSFASPLTRRGVDNPVQRPSNGTINAPLTDWIKNGNTDLQWYTTISVGTPPQNLYVQPPRHPHHHPQVLTLPSPINTDTDPATSSSTPAPKGSSSPPPTAPPARPRPCSTPPNPQPSPPHQAAASPARSSLAQAATPSPSRNPRALAAPP